MDITVKVPHGTQSVSIDKVKGGSGGSGGVMISPIKTPAIDKLPSHLVDTSNLPPGIFSVPNSIGGISITNTCMPPHTIKDYAITGQMLTVEKVLDAYELERTGISANVKNFEDEIKKELIQEMMYEIIKNKCIEFTCQKDMLTGSVAYRARIYVTPDEQTRIIRQIQK